MVVILKNFSYKGENIDIFTCDFPQIKTLEDVDADRVVEYIRETIDAIDAFTHGA